MAWVMTQQIKERPKRYVFLIGQIPIAEISFYRSNAVLNLYGKPPNMIFENMSEALKEMHRMLSCPPEEKEDE